MRFLKICFLDVPANQKNGCIIAKKKNSRGSKLFYVRFYGADEAFDIWVPKNKIISCFGSALYVTIPQPDHGEIETNGHIGLILI